MNERPKYELDLSHLNPTPLPRHKPDEELVITRTQMSLLLLESHRKAANTAEEVMCLKELAKIQGHYDTKPTQVTINIEQQIGKLEMMSDEELLRLTGHDERLFTKPEPVLVEYYEVEDEEIEDNE